MVSRQRKDVHKPIKLIIAEVVMREDLSKIIEDLSKEELHDLNYKVVEKLRHLADIEAQEKAAAFSVGDEVRFRNRQHQWIQGRICRINRKSITVKSEAGYWRVSPGLLQHAIQSPGSQKKHIHIRSRQIS